MTYATHAVGDNNRVNRHQATTYSLDDENTSADALDEEEHMSKPLIRLFRSCWCMYDNEGSGLVMGRVAKCRVRVGFGF